MKKLVHPGLMTHDSAYLPKSFDDMGRELCDPTPIEVPVGISRPLTMQEMLAQYVRSEMQLARLNADPESWEEANDFDVDDPDGGYRSPYEEQALAEENYIKDREKARIDKLAAQRRAAAAAAKKRQPDKKPVVKENVGDAPVKGEPAAPKADGGSPPW